MEKEDFNLIEFIKKYYKVILLILFLPLVIAILMKLVIFKVFSGDANGWLSFWGSYFGGIISGMLTLIGVSYTIISNNKNIKESFELQSLENYKNNMGFRMTKFYELKYIAYEGMRLTDNKYKPDELQIDRIGYVISNLNKMLELSIYVDDIMFEDTKVFVDKVRETYDEGITMEELEPLLDSFTSVVGSEHEDRLIDEFKLVSKKIKEKATII
ncbi:hypothetical protein [Lysinibacillus sp. RS5]|uniref:hypothetical protein n=1 Tax=unclassified Lysinibacillus TaxID=2636778 RepID=UPI0035BE2BAA